MWEASGGEAEELSGDRDPSQAKVSIGLQGPSQCAPGAELVASSISSGRPRSGMDGRYYFHCYPSRVVIPGGSGGP